MFVVQIHQETLKFRRPQEITGSLNFSPNTNLFGGVFVKEQMNFSLKQQKSAILTVYFGTPFPSVRLVGIIGVFWIQKKTVGRTKTKDTW